MTIEAYADTFVGQRVVWYDPNVGAQEVPGSCVYRIGGLEYGETEWPFADLLERFLSDPLTQPIIGLVIGAWTYEDILEESSTVTTALANARDRMPHLRALFVGDILREECEISWINHSPMAALLDSYPELQYFRVRGANGLRFPNLQHANLRSLTIESGGLPGDLLQDIFAADLPELEHLELWLGSENYGAADVNALTTLLQGGLFPKLRYLGLRNYDQIDALTPMLASAPILERIATLDLSLGNLSDDGAAHLISAADTLKKLDQVDLHHHFLTNEVIEQIRNSGIQANVAQQLQADDGYRYIHASE